MAGQNADMTLKVGLDLNFFRQELQKASSSLAGQPIDINIRFNKKGIADQYRLLTRYLGGKKTFDVKIESNTLEALTDKVANFQKTLKTLKDEKIELSIDASANIEKFSKEKIRKIRAQIRRDIVSGGAGEIQLPTKLAAPSTSTFIKDVAKKVKEQISASYAEGGIPIATKLKVPGITDLLKALQKNLNRNPISIATSFKESGKSEAALAKIIRNAEKNKAVLGTELAPLGADEIAEFRRTVESKLSGIKVTVDATLGKGFAAGQTGLAGLEEYMRTQGLSGGPRGAVETGRRAQFESLIGSASSAELKRYMKTAEIAGRSALTTKAQMQEALLKINDVAMENILGNMKMQMRDPLPIKKSFLDQVARAVFWMAGVDPAYLKQQAAQRRALPSVDFPGTVPTRNIPIGPSTTGRALPAGASAAGLIEGVRPPAGLLPAMSVRSQIKGVVDALIAQQGPRGLPPGGGQLVDTKRIYAALRKNLDEILQRQFAVIDTEVRETSSGIKDAMGVFSYFVQALRDAEARAKDARINDAVSSLMREIEGAIKLAQSRVKIIPAQVTDLGTTQRALQGQRVAGLLPAAVGRTPSTYATGAIGGETRAEMLARREREARVRSALRGVDVMQEGGMAGREPAPYSQAYRSARPLSAIVPYAPGGAIVPQPSMAGGGAQPPGGGGGAFGGAGGFGGFGRAMQGISLPGAGTIKELGDEFTFATKQVLLFGQAYKLLGFLQSFPGEIINAAASLQSYENSLRAVTKTNEEFEASSQFVLDLVEKYNIPLEAAEQGFVKLYASMAPAGFSGEDIRGLFEGISQAAATFGMSADKVDRVTYAFAQMASKGQVMSEELKGQLGDVLPGAMAIFASAAGFEGPEAIKKFSEALEDGAFKGKNMTALLKNVRIELTKEFGPGAEGAAKTIQGSLTRIQNSITLLYRGFEPVAVNFLNAVVAPITEGLKIITDGFSSYFSGQEAATKEGARFAEKLRQLTPVFEGLKNNIVLVVEALKPWASGLLSVLEIIGRVASSPLTGWLVVTYGNVLLLNTAFNFLGGQAIVSVVSAIGSSIGQFIALNTQMALLQRTTAVTSSSLAGTQIQMALLTRNGTPLIPVITQLRNAVAGLNLALLANPYIAAAAAIVAIGVAAYKMNDAFREFVNSIPQRMQIFWESLANDAEFAINRAIDLWQDFSRIAQTVAINIGKFFSNLWTNFKNFAKNALKSVGVDVNWLGEAMANVANEIEYLWNLLFYNIKKNWRDVVAFMVNNSSPILRVLKEAGLIDVGGAVADALGKLPPEPTRKTAPKPARTTTKPGREDVDITGESDGTGKGKGTKERESRIPLLELELATTQQLFDLERQIITAKLGGNELEVLRLEGLKEQLRINQEIAKVKLDSDIPAGEKILQIQRLMKEAEMARLQNTFDLEMKILEVFQGIQDSVIEIGKQASNELSDKREYERLVTEGILPSVARITVETNRQFAVEAEKLSLLETQIKDQIALLSAKEQITDQDQKQLDILRNRLKIVQEGQSDLPDLAQETIQSRIEQNQVPSGRVIAMEETESMSRELEKLVSWEYQAVQGAQAIGAAISEAMTTGIASLVSGTATAKEVFASFLQGVAQSLAQAAQQIIATYIAIGLAKIFAGFTGGSGFKFSGQGPVGLPGALNPLGGADVAGNFAPNFTFANGGIAQGGFQAFANGGVVSGPTLGLVGEGRYNEAVVPLPNGRAIPVQVNGERSARDLMGGKAPGMAQAAPLTLKFESTKINGVEYVSREQLELAMAETRRASIAGGATRGMNMALDKIQQSPSTRSRIGIR